MYDAERQMLKFSISRADEAAAGELRARGNSMEYELGSWGEIGREV